MFLDESGFSLCLYRLYGWAPQHERCEEAVPFVRGINRSVLGAFSLAGLQASVQKLGTIKRLDFESFLKERLLPLLPADSVLVLDNARIHHGGQIETLVQTARCSLLYLPPYSPDFSPIELAWSWVKNRVRFACPRDDTAREQEIRQALDSLPAHHASVWFRKCGYHQG